jgi:predicted nucleotidyltransferase
MTNKFAEEAWPKGGTPLFKEVQSPYFLPVTEEILAEIVRRIVEKFDPEKIVLFGSYAHGAPHQDSDVDLFVVMNTNMQYVDRCVEISELILPRPFPVDIVVKTPQELEQDIQRNNFFVKEAIETGRVLYERSGKPKRLG